MKTRYETLKNQMRIKLKENPSSMDNLKYTSIFFIKKKHGPGLK